MEHSCSVSLPLTPFLSSTDIPVVTPSHPTHAATHTCSVFYFNTVVVTPSASDASSFPENETSPHQLPSSTCCTVFWLCWARSHPYCSRRQNDVHLHAHVLRFPHPCWHHNSKQQNNTGILSWLHRSVTGWKGFVGRMHREELIGWSGKLSKTTTTEEGNKKVSHRDCLQPSSLSRISDITNNQPCMHL